jgi:DNA-binding MarR family transcriptional regulator
MSNLEEEIQQSTFSSIKQKVLLNLIFTANWLRAGQIKLFKQHGISPEQYNVLRILRGQKGNAIGVNKIQERMLDKNSNASRLIDKLSEKGLVDRLGCKNDRRQVEIFITPKGLDLLTSLDEVMDLQEKSSINLTIGESEELNKLLNKLRTNN